MTSAATTSAAYEAEREVSAEEAERHREEVRAFISDWDRVAVYLMTLRRDGRPLMRPVSAFVEGWTIQTVTQDVHLKTKQVRRNPIVAYLFTGLEARERGNDPVSVYVQGVARLVEDAAEVEAFYERRAAATGRPRGHPGDSYTPSVIRTTPQYLRAEGFSGRRHPVIYRDFPGLAPTVAQVP